MKGWQSRIAAVAAAALIGAAAPASAQIVLGVAGPITGPNAAFGEQLRRGVDQAVKDINAAGGLLGQQIRVVVGDDASDPRQGVAAANQLASQGAKGVIGHFNSSVSIPSSQVYNDEGIFMITPASTNPTLTEQGFDAVFRTCGRDDQQGSIAGARLARDYAGRKVAIIHDNTTYGKGLADATKAAMNAAGLQEAMYEAVNTGQRDFSALITRMKDAGVNAIYFGGLHNEAGLMIRQAREQNLAVDRLISGDGIVTQEFWTITGPAGEGTLMTFGPDQRNSPAAASVVQSFRAQNYEPEGYTLYSYAAVQVWAEGVRRANSTDAAAVAAAVRRAPIPTVIGNLDYDAKGDRKDADYVWYEWKNGQYAQVN
jgi:branched-chain amino acid transport system substrate-binding protein